MHNGCGWKARLQVTADALGTKLGTLLLFMLAGLLGGASGLYMLGGYASGLPSSWWSGPLVWAVLGGSLALIVAGLSMLISQGLARPLALVGGGLLELFLLTTILAILRSVELRDVRVGITWAPFFLLLLVPLLLTTASLVVAWRSR